MLILFIAAVGVFIAYYIGRQHACVRPSSIVPERVEQALDTLTEGLLIVDEHERIVLANEAFTETTGLAKQSILGQKIDRLPWVWSHSIKGSSPWTRSLTEAISLTDQMMLLERENGDRRYLLINSNPVTELDRGVRSVLVTFRDVTDVELRRSEMERSLAMMRTYREQIGNQNCELQRLASHDPLTGCLNRRAFFDAVQPMLGESQQDESSVSCLMVDSDHFKQINDSYGHSVGDEVLRRIASTLHNVVGDSGLVCRYGGEEFCVVLPKQDSRSAASLAEETRKAIEQLRFENNEGLQLTVSIGVSQLESGDVDATAIIKRADQSLYVAKELGRNRVVVYDPMVVSASMAPAVDHASKSHVPVHEYDRERLIPFEAVTALVSALAYRDRGTAEHSRRVADLCVMAASGLLDYRSTYILETAAMLHDIGKIGVPDSILSKPSPLSREEWKMIRQYDRLGAGIIAGTFNCEELDEVVRNLHTPFGYLAYGATEPIGPSLPISSRLLAIADGYDAMRTDKPYRKGRSHDECISELRRYSGVQFDPELVEHFAKMIGPESVPNCPSSGNISKRTAMKFGMQIERFARAIDAKDTVGLKMLADELTTIAREHRIDAIADAASRLHHAAEDENAQWLRLLNDTQLVLEMCRATQRVFLTSPVSTKSTAESKADNATQPS
jgi:diguanylate cyclase (GGDEF)-like protein/PAS domain S-box-containing protein